MRRIVAAAVLALAVGSSAQAGDSFAGVPLGSGGRGPTTRTAFIDSHNGAARPTATRLQPVVGSVQRTGHFTNPLTHKSKYSSVNYNPVLGTFGTQKFRR